MSTHTYMYVLAHEYTYVHIHMYIYIQYASEQNVHTVARNRDNAVRPLKKTRSNDGTTRLVDRCDRVENVHASYHVDARVHIRPVFSGSVIINFVGVVRRNPTVLSKTTACR